MDNKETYTIVNPRTGIELGTYEARTAQDALDAMARDAGYKDYAVACAEAGGSDLLVTQIKGGDDTK